MLGKRAAGDEDSKTAAGDEDSKTAAGNEDSKTKDNKRAAETKGSKNRQGPQCNTGMGRNWSAKVAQRPSV